MEKIDIKNYIKLVNKIHDNKYDYSKVNYVNMRTKIIIICPIHGEFLQTPSIHKRSGCIKCSIENKKNNNFVQDSIQLHNNKYDYSKVKYINNSTKVKIICPTHGEFNQTPKNHLNQKQGCPKCHIDQMYLTTKNFVNKSSKIHNNKYDYSKAEYINNSTKVKIICPTHGEFLQTPNNHLNQNQGCPRCKIEKSKLSFEQFKINSNISHNNKYKYPNQEFDFNKKVKIICPIHGEFTQLPNNHSNKSHGCPKCNFSKGERKISNILNKMNVKYFTEYKFDGCVYKRRLRFDFYLPNHDMCIEYNGRQHYESINYFGGNNVLNEQIKKDLIKFKFCKDNLITLIIIKYDEDIENILFNLFK